MKKQIHLSFLLILASALLFTCNNEQNNSATKSGEARTTIDTIEGQVKHYNKNGSVIALAGVIVTQGTSFRKDTTNSEGKFQLFLDGADSRKVKYEYPGLETLEHEYLEANYLEEIHVYLEDQTDSGGQKIIFGTTLKEKKYGKEDPFEGIKVSETTSRNNDLSNSKGVYRIPMQNRSIDQIKYDFKYQGNPAYILIKTPSDIKDSSKLDVVLSIGAEPFPMDTDDN